MLNHVEQTERVASLNMECTVQGTRSNLCFLQHLQLNWYEHFPDNWTLDIQHIIFHISNGSIQCGLELHLLELDSMNDAIVIKLAE